MGTEGEQRGAANRAGVFAQALAALVITSVQGRTRALSCPVHHNGDAEASLVQLFWKYALLHVCFF